MYADALHNDDGADRLILMSTQPTMADLTYIFGGPITFGREHGDGEVEMFASGLYVGTRHRGTGVITFAPADDLL